MDFSTVKMEDASGNDSLELENAGSEEESMIEQLFGFAPNFGAKEINKEDSIDTLRRLQSDFDPSVLTAVRKHRLRWMRGKVIEMLKAEINPDPFFRQLIQHCSKEEIQEMCLVDGFCGLVQGACKKYFNDPKREKPALLFRFLKRYNRRWYDVDGDILDAIGLMHGLNGLDPLAMLKLQKENQEAEEEGDEVSVPKRLALSMQTKISELRVALLEQQNIKEMVIAGVKELGSNLMKIVLTHKGLWGKEPVVEALDYVHYKYVQEENFDDIDSLAFGVGGSKDSEPADKEAISAPPAMPDRRSPEPRRERSRSKSRRSRRRSRSRSRSRSRKHERRRISASRGRELPYDRKRSRTPERRRRRRSSERKRRVDRSRSRERTDIKAAPRSRSRERPLRSPDRERPLSPGRERAIRSGSRDRPLRPRSREHGPMRTGPSNGRSMQPPSRPPLRTEYVRKKPDRVDYWPRSPPPPGSRPPEPPQPTPQPSVRLPPPREVLPAVPPRRMTSDFRNSGRHYPAAPPVRKLVEPALWERYSDWRRGEYNAIAYASTDLQPAPPRKLGSEFNSIVQDHQHGFLEGRAAASLVRPNFALYDYPPPVCTSYFPYAEPPLSGVRSGSGYAEPPTPNSHKPIVSAIPSTEPVIEQISPKVPLPPSGHWSGPPRPGLAPPVVVNPVVVPPTYKASFINPERQAVIRKRKPLLDDVVDRGFAPSLPPQTSTELRPNNDYLWREQEQQPAPQQWNNSDRDPYWSDNANRSAADHAVMLPPPRDNWNQQSFHAQQTFSHQQLYRK